jgi:hypothetical protein
MTITGGETSEIHTSAGRKTFSSAQLERLARFKLALKEDKTSKGYFKTLDSSLRLEPLLFAAWRGKFMFHAKAQREI